MKPYLNREKLSHYERYRLNFKVVSGYDENKINELNQCLTEKLDHVMPLLTYFHGQLQMKITLHAIAMSL